MVWSTWYADSGSVCRRRALVLPSVPVLLSIRVPPVSPFYLAAGVQSAEACAEEEL